MNEEEVYEAILAYVSTVLKYNDATHELRKVEGAIAVENAEEEGHYCLDACLIWADTVQGHDFWCAIYSGDVPEKYKDAYNV